MEAKELPINKIICGDVKEVLKSFPEESIDLIIFSPPYWGLRDYGEDTVTIWDGDPECEHDWYETVDDVEGYTSKKRRQHGIKRGTHPDKWSRRIRKYGFCRKCGAWRGQLGLEPHPQMYINHMVTICRELKRVLKRSGSMYIDLGDAYFASTRRDRDRKLVKDAGIDFKFPKEDGEWLRPKQKLLIPFRIAIALQEDGWIIRNDIIWHKPNAMPSSVKDRLNVTHEYIFHCVKSRRYYYNLDAIREPHGPALPKLGSSKRGGGRSEISPFFARGEKSTRSEEDWKWNKETSRMSWYHNLGKLRQKMRDLDLPERNPKGKNPGDVFLKQDNVPTRNINVYRGFNARYKPREDGKNPGDIVTTKWGAIERGGSFADWKAGNPRLTHPSGKAPGDFWSISTKPFPEAHFAVYPPALLVKPILSSCPPDGIVLDPFMGSGTTALTCELINRKLWDKIPYTPNEVAKKIDWNLKWIGIEIKKEYVEMAYRRLKPCLSQARLLAFLSN